MIKNGKIWPVGIALAIFGVVLLSYWTIKEASIADLTQSSVYDSKYQEVDKNINDIIISKIKFNRKYNLTFEDINLDKNNSVIIYKITDKNNKPINNAKLELKLVRPDSSVKDIVFTKPIISNGIYEFKDVKLPKEGRWDLYLKVTIGDDQRFYNLKADTRDEIKFRNNKRLEEF